MGGYLLKNKANLKESIDKILSLFDPLKVLLKRTAGTLSGGEQQMLTFGRALMMNPKLLIADEPSLGLSPNYVEIIAEKLKQINLFGTSILLVEQNVALALEVSNRTYIFEMGHISFNDTSENIQKNIDLKSKYFGE